MKVFKRHRTSTEIKTLAEPLGIEVDTRAYDKGSAHIILRTPAVEVLFNVANGRFFGAIPAIPGKQSEIHFNSDNDRADAWYQALVNFFYTDEEAPE